MLYSEVTPTKDYNLGVYVVMPCWVLFGLVKLLILSSTGSSRLVSVFPPLHGKVNFTDQE